VPDVSHRDGLLSQHSSDQKKSVARERILLATQDRDSVAKGSMQQPLQSFIKESGLR
jgi:hypothetical protein